MAVLCHSEFVTAACAHDGLDITVGAPEPLSSTAHLKGASQHPLSVPDAFTHVPAQDRNLFRLFLQAGSKHIVLGGASAMASRARIVPIHF